MHLSHFLTIKSHKFYANFQQVTQRPFLNGTYYIVMYLVMYTKQKMEINQVKDFVQIFL